MEDISHEDTQIHLIMPLFGDAVRRKHGVVGQFKQWNVETMAESLDVPWCVEFAAETRSQNEISTTFPDYTPRHANGEKWTPAGLGYYVLEHES